MMENMLEEIAKASNEEQTAIFSDLEKKLGADITDKLRERVFYIKLYSDKDFYNKAMNTLGNQLYTELSR